MRDFDAGNCKCSLFLCTFLCPFALSADWAAELSQEEEAWQPPQLLWVRAEITLLDKVNKACFFL